MIFKLFTQSLIVPNSHGVITDPSPSLLLSWISNFLFDFLKYLMIFHYSVPKSKLILNNPWTISLSYLQLNSVLLHCQNKLLLPTHAFEFDQSSSMIVFIGFMILLHDHVFEPKIVLQAYDVYCQYFSVVTLKFYIHMLIEVCYRRLLRLLIQIINA